MSGPRRNLRIRYKADIMFSGGIYHVTQRAPGKEVIFVEDEDYQFMIGALKTVASDYKLDVFAFCCMPNHIHLLLRTNENNLIDAMKILFEKYAKYFNRKYERKGHVFCGSFAAALCAFDDYFLAISLYIHLNPCAGGMCHDYALYRWSSVRVYIDKIRQTFISRSYLFEMIDPDPDTAREEYRDLLEATRDVKVKKFIFKNEDAAEYKQMIVEELKRKERFQSLLRRIFSTVVTRDEIDAASKKGGRRVRDEASKQRRRYVIEQLKAEGYSMSDIAKKLNINRSSLYQSIK